MKRSRRLRIGCAITSDRIVAVVSRARTEPVHVEIGNSEASVPRHERIALAFAEAINSALENAGARVAVSATVRVALLPPLAQIRRLHFPLMREQERTRVLSRDAVGYFFNAREPHVAAAHALPARRAADRQVIATAAPAALLDALHDTLPKGVRIDAFVPAAAAWAAAQPRRGGRTAASVVADSIETTITSEHRLLMDVRHRAAASDASTTGATADAATSAARHAWLARSPLLRTPVQQMRLRAARSRRTRFAAVAAIALTMTGTTGTYVSLQRELASVRRERAALSSALAPALARRDSLLRLETRLGAARVLSGGAPWTELLSTVAQRLPADAHIVYMVGVGDSVMLRVEAATAANVLPVLRDAPVFQDVRIAGAVERDATDPAAVTDRFDVTARIRSLGAQQ